MNKNISPQGVDIWIEPGESVTNYQRTDTVQQKMLADNPARLFGHD